MSSIVVVGSGAAGLAAAVGAAEAGGDVLVLDRAPRKSRGGNSFYTEAYFRLASENDLAPGFREDFVRLSEGLCDMALVETLTANAIPTIHWVRDLGVRFDPTLPTTWLVSGLPRLLPSGGGAAILDVLEARARDLGVEFAYERAAHGLKVVNGKVTGIEVVDPTGRPESYDASSVILACGGFEGNPDMEREHLPGPLEGLRPFAPGARYNQGEGIEMALRIGAKPAGEYGNFHASVVDPRSDLANPGVKCFSYGVVLNRKGERFADEGEKSPELESEELARAIWLQPGAVAYAIVDGSFFGLPRWQRAMRTDQPGISADSLDELVEKLPFEDRGRAMRTLRDFNEAARPGGIRGSDMDGVAAMANGVRKSNWAYRLESRPFVAYPAACGIVFTFGGVAATSEGQVLNVENSPVPGLFAVGETAGLYYKHYVGATSVMRGLVFGRIAGGVAAKKSA